MKISTAQEAINGNSNDTVITPLRLKQVLNSKNIGGGGSGGITKETDPVFNASPAAGITNENIENWNKKQDKLVSGTNIKRVNGKSILGSGDIFFNTILSVNKPINGEDIWFQRNVNLFRIMETKTGYYIKQDGSLGYKADDRYFINDYMEVKANTSYSLSKKIYASGYHAWYDSSKNLISTFSQPNNSAITVTSPSNAAYIRFSLFDDPNGYGSDKLTFTFEETNPTSSENCIYINDGSGNYIEFFNVNSVPTKTSQLENDSNFINQIKTINGQSLIGEGNVVIEGGSGGGGIGNETDPIFKSSPAGSITTSDVENWNAKQEALVSGTNIKTINGQDILGEGNIVIEGGSTGGSSGVDTIYTGQLLGGTSVELSGVKRFLDIYFLVRLSKHRIFGKYTIDTSLEEPNYGSVVLMASDSSTGLEYYVSESKFENSTNILTHTRTGYFNISKNTYTDRTSGTGASNYYIYRIDTYDEPVTVITENITETDPVFVASPAYNITNEDIEKWNNPQEVPESSISYNVGDVVITSSNVGNDEMANRFGGEWELFDKEFSTKVAQGAITISSNTSEETGWWTRCGHTIQIDLRWKNSKQLNDDTVKIGSLNYETLGVDAKLPVTSHFIGYTDTGECALFIEVISGDGTINVVDVVPDEYVVTGNSNYATITLVCPKDYMLDSACDKFYWKKLS